MKKIRLLFLTLVALLGMALPSHAADVTVYIDPVGDETWTSDGAKISLNVFTDGQTNNTWIALSAVEGNVLKATFDDSYNRMIVVRGANQDAWGWNQTENITPANNKLYKANGYTGSNLAYTVSDYVGYSVDFNTKITTDNHDFKVAKGWNHIVSTNDYDGNGPYYMNYYYYGSMGVGSTGCLCATRQYAGDYSGGGVVNDILVTPAVNGTVKLDIKAYSTVTNSNPAYVEVYAINNDGTLGELQKTIKEDIAGYNTGNTTEWATFELADLASEQKLGLRCQYVYIDNFTATSVNIPAARTLEVTKVANLEGNSGSNGTTTYFEQQSDGNLKVQLQVTLTNTGDYDFAPGDDGYTLTLASASYASGVKTYYDAANVNIPEALAAGETKAIDVDFTIPYSTGWKYYFVRENISGTTSSSYRYASEIAYESKFVLREAGSTSTTDLTGTVNYGKISIATPKSFEIYNDGTGPLTIKSITLPTGFTSDNLPVIPAGGLVVSKKSATASFDITLPVDVTGAISGDLTIVYDDAAGAEQTKSVTLTGNVLAAGQWFADFDVANSSETNYPAGSVAEGGIRFGTTYISSGNYDGYLYSYTYSSYATENNKFITPKLHAAAGDKLTFDVRRDDSSSSTYNLKVYVSTDRKTWGDPVYSVTAADLTSAYQTKEISFDVTDDYYVAFAIYGVRVDNLVGLTKVDVAHDLYIKSVSWPDASIKSGTAQSKPSVDIIPLTNETADNYTVKYIYGENEVVIGSKALTASANSTTNFAASFTPEVAKTTTFPGTKVVFEFTDGTKFETETFDLTVTNEPIFYFMNSKQTSRWYAPSSQYTTPYNFGKTNSADSKTFWILNWGSAPLTVKSIAVPEGFTASVASMNLPAFDGTQDGLETCQQSFDITFTATEAGTYNGNLVVTYVDANGDDQTYELAISGTKLDPTKFYATFGSSSDASNFPAGSLAQANISITTPTTDNGAIVSSSSTKNLFITPLLASEGETLQFDAKKRSSYYDGSVKVYALSDHIAAANTTTDAEFEALSPTLLGEYTVDVSDFTTYSVEIPTGSSYIALKVADAYVDEIYGLKVANVAHDWQIASSNIPAEGMQNYTSTATVNVLNLGIADEAADSYTVTAYVDGVAAGTGTAVAIPMNHKLSDAGTQLSVSYMSNKVGTFPVYLEVKAGDYSVQTAPVDVTFAAEVAISGIQVGTKSTTSSSVPFYTSWMDDSAGKSMSDFIYTPEQLAAFGITAGAKITSIKFVGNPSGTKTISSLTTDVWVAQQSVASFTAGSPDKGSMTHVNIHNAESVTFTSGSAYEFNIDLTENPIVYDGTSGIRIYTNINGNGQYQAVNFDIDNNYKNAYYAHGTGSFSSVTGNPVAFFNLAVETATLSGYVKNSSDAGIEGATITLKAANGVEYSGTTAADGYYSMNVIQAGLDFTATVEKAGYLTKQFAYNLGGASQTLNVDLYTQMGIVGTFPGFSWDADKVMTQSTEDPNIFTLTVEGVNIAAAGTFEYKLRADAKWGAYDKPAGGDPAANDKGNYEFGFGTKMYPAGTYNLIFTANTTDHTLTLQPVLQLTLDDSEASALDYENAPADVTVGRTLKAGWNAMVLPFDVTAEEIAAQFGANAQVAEFTGDEKNDDKVSVNFAKSDVITANKPFLINLESVPGTVKFLNKSVTFAEAKTEGTNFDFVGIYADGSAAAGDYIMAGGMLKYANGGNAIKAYRSYLKTKGAASARISIFLDGELIGEAEGTGDATGIQGIGVKQAEGLYNMGGQKVTGRTKKGVYILNGKKVFVGDKH